jgi:hypothetical protein
MAAPKSLQLTDAELTGNPELYFRLIDIIGEGYASRRRHDAPARCAELTADAEQSTPAWGHTRRRSYGSVHKAVHQRTGTVVAIKVVPIENDLQDIVREVNVMNGLSSEYIVNLYGSYLKDTNLWVRLRHPLRFMGHHGGGGGTAPRGEQSAGS